MKASLYIHKKLHKKKYNKRQQKKYRRIHSAVKLEGKTTFVNF